MKVKLIGYTQGSQDSTQEGLDNVEDMIAFCARVSNPTNQINTETTTKLHVKCFVIGHSPFKSLANDMQILVLWDTRSL